MKISPAAMLLRVFCLYLFIWVDGQAQQPPPPKKDRVGNAVFVVRNDAIMSVTIEYRNTNGWQALMIEPTQDNNISGDRIRVATTRDDKALVTVDLAVEAGRKYHLYWNAQSRIWDFKLVP
jgi:hypothetical protein